MEQRPIGRGDPAASAPSDDSAGGTALQAQRWAADSAGTPVPLGLVAFGIPVFIAGIAFSGWWSHPLVSLVGVASVLVIFGGIVQFLAGMWAFRTGEVLAGTFFGVFGGVLGTLGVGFRWGFPAALNGANAWPLAVAAGCLCFVALYLGLAALASHPGVGVASLALAVSLFFAAWSLFAGELGWAAAVAGWAAIGSGGLALIGSAVVASASSVARFRAVGPLGALIPRPVGRPTSAGRTA
jgi:succinate-acetate transporter protein